MENVEATAKVAIAPSTDQILAEVQRESMTWEKALGEPIDNSLDAGATRITITIDKKEKRVRIDDDGSGSDEPHMMFVSGYSTKRGRAKKDQVVGRYGVGLKHASYYLCGVDGMTTVVTGTADRCQQVRVRWRDVVKSGVWEIDAPIDLPPEAAAPALHGRSGTSLTFQPIKRTWPYQSTYDKLAFTFSPALRSGKQVQIIVNGKPSTLSAPRDPVWSESIEFEVAVGQKVARVRAGILAVNDKSGRRGLSYSFGHRVIVADTEAGCGDFSTQGFAGFVELDHHWGLGQNKSQVTDAAWPELCEAISERLRPMLAKLKDSAQQMHSEALRGSVAGALNQILGKPKRPGRRGSKRRKSPQGGRRPVEAATIVDGLGGALGGRKKRPGGSLNIDWLDNPDIPEAAKVDPNGSRVYLNRAKSIIAKSVETQNHEMLAVIAASHLFHSDIRSSLFGNREFGDLMGSLLDSPIVMGAAPC